MKGYIHSFESFGTVDGPGIRYVIFLKGCPLRCKYCHNPDTWTRENSQILESDDVVKQALRYKGYWGDKGGITLTGGEPLGQYDFALELLKKFKENGVRTCVDTSGYFFNPNDESKYLELIKYVDLFLLDIKHIRDDKHQELTGVSNKNILEFAKFLSRNGKKMWIRHVIVPGITLNDEYLLELKKFVDTLENVEKIEVLPYHTMGTVKYQKLGIPYPLEGVEPPSKEEISHVKEILEVKKYAAK